MIKKIILTALILNILLVGCQKAEEVIVTEATDISVDTEISEVDALDEELNLDELDNLEAELDEINW